MITIPKKIAQSGDLMVVEKRSFEKLAKENTELKSAIKAVLEGELALCQRETRSL